MSTEDQTPKDEPVNLHFSIVSALGIYTKDGEAKQRTVNVMLETVTPNISRPDLDRVNEGVISRLMSENGIEPGDMKDIVILNIARLAYMPRNDFYGFTEEEIAQMQAETEAA